MIQARTDHQFVVRVRVGRSSLLPAIPVAVAIAEQPVLPDRPYLVLQVRGGLAGLALPLAGVLAALPSWVQVRGDRVVIDLRALAAQYGLTPVFARLRDASVTTTDGRFLLSMRAAL